MTLLIRGLTQTEKENVMLIPKEDFVLNQATQWFRRLERHLAPSAGLRNFIRHVILSRFSSKVRTLWGPDRLLRHLLRRMA